jgi:hypothetical protein
VADNKGPNQSSEVFSQEFSGEWDAPSFEVKKEQKPPKKKRKSWKLFSRLKLACEAFSEKTSLSSGVCIRIDLNAFA